MKALLRISLLLIFLFTFGCSKDSQQPNIPDVPEGMYYPPMEGSEWETLSVTQLKWNENKLQDLYNYLESKGTKGFMILKNGRIVSEKYFNGHSISTNWTWFSAAKSLTAAFVGVAQDEGIISINNKTSDYLGDNWSSLPNDKQDLITVKHHLSMSTGLTDHVGNFVPWICTLPICLTYTADAATRWAYHQGAFILLQKIISQNTEMSFQAYCKAKITDKIGMKGSWSTALGLNTYNSNTRSMARFGLLMLNKGTWDQDHVLSQSFFNEMTNTSQAMNKSYGYCWWLNGKESFMGTSSQVVGQGSLIPNAPSDMIAALGAEDQKIYVVPSKGLVVIRNGESAGEAQLGLSSFDNELWGMINEVIND